MTKHSDKLQRIKKIVQSFAGQPGPLLEALLAVQASEGYIAEQWVPVIASELNVSRAEVHGVISFYHDLKTEPSVDHHLKICCAEACQAMGSRKLVQRIEQYTGLQLGDQCAAKGLALESVYCFGNCSCAPSVQLDDKLYGRVSEKKLQNLLETLGKAETTQDTIPVKNR